MLHDEWLLIIMAFLICMRSNSESEKINQIWYIHNIFTFIRIGMILVPFGMFFLLFLECTHFRFLYIWNWALKSDMEIKSVNLPNNSNKNNIPNKIRIHVSMRLCLLFICRKVERNICHLLIFLSYANWAILPWLLRQCRNQRHTKSIILIRTTMSN